MDEEQRERLRALGEQKAALLAKLPQTPFDTTNISSSSLKQGSVESSSAREGKEEDGGKYDYHSDIILSNDDGDDRPDIYTTTNTKPAVSNNVDKSIPVVSSNTTNTVFAITVLESLPLNHSSTGSDVCVDDAPTVYEVIEADY